MGRETSRRHRRTDRRSLQNRTRAQDSETGAHHLEDDRLKNIPKPINGHGEQPVGDATDGTYKIGHVANGFQPGAHHLEDDRQTINKSPYGQRPKEPLMGKAKVQTEFKRENGMHQGFRFWSIRPFMFASLLVNPVRTHMG